LVLRPDWLLEHEAAQSGHRLIAGVDEVGRGPLAGPVITAAVILPLGLALDLVRDSKSLTHDQRLRAREEILGSARAVAYGAAGPGEIDRFNIHQASLTAMKRAVLALEPRPDFVLVDGRHELSLEPGLGLAQRAVVKGDARSVSVAAASILAKVRRDRIMDVLDRVFPGYGLAAHKGYPTRAHREALCRLGPCPAHRRSYRPLREVQGELFD